MKKWLIPVIAVVLLIALTLALILIFGRFNLNRAERRLADAGYTVIRTGKGAPEHLQKTDEDVVATLSATGGPNGEQITVIRFKDKEVAKSFEELQKKAYESNYFYTVKREGKVVIYGWTNAYDIIK